MNQRRICLEVCVGSVADAVLASKLGADRIELNTALALGGLTPSPGAVATVKEQIRCGLVVMNRPRDGGFHYDIVEQEAMSRDVDWMIALQVDGIAFGFLDASQEIDTDATKRFVDRVAGRATTVFHRAFDLVAEPIRAIDLLIDLGVDRILTSGLAKNAMEGSKRLSELIQHAAGRIEILPAAGIRPSNVQQLCVATGCDQVHASLSKESESLSQAEIKLRTDRQISFIDPIVNEEITTRRLNHQALDEMLEMLAKPNT